MSKPLDILTASHSAPAVEPNRHALDSAILRRQSIPLSRRPALSFAAVGVLAFHLAHSVAPFSFLILVFLFCVAQLARVSTARAAFYAGLGVGVALYGPQLGFFWTIFGPAAVALWLVLAFWIGLFVLLAHLCWRRWNAVAFSAALPILWTACEYFRSELYYLRFSWLSVGYAFADAPMVAAPLGAYGLSFVLMLVVAVFLLLKQLEMKKLAWAGALSSLASLAFFSQRSAVSANTPAADAAPLRVAGVQLEFPGDTEVLQALNELAAKHPAAQLLVLSEYTFQGPVPETIKAWCRNHQRFLIAGGKDPVAENDKEFYDTTFVVGPGGDIIFKQGKAVPIQFFNDGLPAREQKVWDSPWGKLGLCVCYDLSYTRVTDELIRHGARALIVPTMDVVEWGRHQHELHARVAPIRAAEYRVPIFRVASSGISQIVDRSGRVTASAPFPGPAAVIAGELQLGPPGKLPLDRVLAPVCVALTTLLTAWLAVSAWRQRGQIANRKSQIANP